MRPCAALALVALALAVGCKPAPEKLAASSAKAAQRNLEDRAAITKEGSALLIQGRCTIDHIIAADDADRHYLACNGFTTAAGENPHLNEFRALHGSNVEAIAAACADPAMKWPAVGATYCKDISLRQQAKAESLRAEYRADGRCTNAAIRASADPDFHYLVCYDSRFGLFPRRVHLARFRDRFGPDLASIRGRCSEIQTQLEADEKSPRDPRAPSLAFAFNIYCTDEVPRGMFQ